MSSVKLRKGQRWMVYHDPNNKAGQSFEFTLGNQISSTTWEIIDSTWKGGTLYHYAYAAWWSDNSGADHKMILLCSNTNI